MRLSPLQVCIGAFASAAGATTVTDNAAFASNKTFDFVIAGAGLSGITVANKVRAIPRVEHAVTELAGLMATDIAQRPRSFRASVGSRPRRLMESGDMGRRALSVPSCVLQLEVPRVRRRRE